MTGLSLKRDLPVLAALSLAASLYFLYNLGGYGLLDPTEPFYALSAREMLQRGDPWTPYLFGAPQFEKPIFFYWVLYASFSALGVSEFAARLGPALAGIAGVCVVYLWGRLLFGRVRPALLSALFLCTAAEFAALSRTAFTDIFLLFFTASAGACFSAGVAMPARRALFWRGTFLFCGLAFLTKGPIGLIVPFAGIGAYLAAAGRRDMVTQIPWRSGLALFAVAALPWYALMTARHGAGFLQDFFVHENLRRFFVAEHRGMDRPWFYPAGLLLGLFPWSVFLFPALARSVNEACVRRPGTFRQRTLFLLWMFLAPFLLIASAKSKLLTYILPVFPPLALLAGDWVDRAARALSARTRTRGSRPELKALVLLFWGAGPAFLAAAAWVYDAKHGLGLKAPIAAAASAMALPLWTACALFMLRRYRLAVVSAAVSTAGLAAVSFGWLLPTASTHFSSRQPAGSLAGPASQPPPRVLSSKMFVRGLSYYSPRPIEVVVAAEYPKKVFYTPHPLSFVSSRRDLDAMDPAGFPMRAYLRQKELGFLRRIGGDKYLLRVVEDHPQWSLVELERAARD